MREVGRKAELQKVLAGHLQACRSWAQLPLVATLVAEVKFTFLANGKTLKVLSARIKLTDCFSVLLKV